MLLASCSKKTEHTYDHVQFISSIEKTSCHLCGDRTDTPLSDYLGQCNLGIIDLNTFDAESAPVFEYTPSSDVPLMEPAGTIQFKSATFENAGMTMMINSDRGYADISIDNAVSKIEPDKISGFLCQTCLDTFSEQYFADDAPVSLAVVDFSNCVISPLITSRPTFFLGDYLIDCDFQDEGKIDLLVVYRPSRFA